MKKQLISSVLALCMLFPGMVAGTVTTQAKTVDDNSVAAPIISESTGSEYGLASNIQDGVILHCFDWKYNDIKAELQNIAAAGFTSVQTSPPQANNNSGTWYWLYQPRGFYIGTNDLGTKSDLQSLCSEAEKYGVKVICDVVANHLEGEHSNIDDELKPSQYWHDYRGDIDWGNRYQITHGEIGMADLATENSFVQSKVKTYLQELKGIGVDGIRWDAAKHIGLPSEGDNFWKEVTQLGLYNYGEILDEPGGDGSSVMKEYTNYISVTDNGYGNTIRDAFAGGGVTGSYGNWAARGVSSNKLVYWAESHDTYANGGNGSQYIDQNKIDRAYATVAARSDATSLYFSRPSSKDKESIKGGQKGSTHFTSKEVAAVNQFHNAMVGKADYYTSSNGCAVITRKDGGAVIVKGSGSGQVSVANGGGYAKSGTYTDQVSGGTFTVSGSTISGNIGSSGIAVIYDAKPVESVSVTPGTKNGNTNYKTDTYTLTLNATNVSNAQYSIDNGSYSAYSDGKTITIGSGVSYGTVTKVTVKADNVGPYTYSYTKVDPTLTQKIYFDNSSYNWSSVYAYIYSSDESSNNGAWPGTQMTKDSSTGYYVIEVPEAFANGLVIFTENNTATTNRYPADMQPGLSLDGTTKLFSANHKFEEYNSPTPSVNPTVQPTTQVVTQPATQPITQPVTTPYTGSQRAYFDNASYNWSSVYAYIYNDTTSNNGAWPGTQMSKDSASGYYYVDIPSNFSNGYIIFTENSTATQNRYPADMQPGLPLDGKTKLFRENRDFSEYTPVQPTVQPVTTQPVTTQPVTTQPVTTQPVTTQPVTEPQTDKLTLNVKSGIFPDATKTFDKDTKTVTITFKLTSSMNVVNGQWKLSYDNTKLQYNAAYNKSNGVQTIMPVIGSDLVYNVKTTYIKGNYTSLNMYDFSKDQPYVKITFDVIGTGTADIDFDLEILSVGYKGDNGETKDAAIIDYSQFQNISNISGFENAKVTNLQTLLTSGALTGDVDGDGDVTVKDATDIVKHLAGVSTLTAEQLKLADVNGDGTVDINDVTRIQQYIAMLITNF